MSESDLCLSSLVEAARRVKARELSPVELTTAVLARIEALDGALHSYLTVLGERALAQAKAAEQEIASGDYRGPLHGIPIAVKDLCFTQGVPTSCASKVLAGWVPAYDATVVARLEAAGAVLLGKLNMTEFAMSGYHPELPIPINPWDAARWCGGSSSGSAVATVAGLCFGSLGTDTGGSIRFPAAACGAVGLKPTQGRVSRYGVFPLAESLDHVGPITRTAADAGAMLDVIAGFDPNDPTSRREPAPDCQGEIGRDVRGVRIALDERFATEGTQPEVGTAVLDAVRVLEGLGAEVVELRAPAVEDVLPAWPALCAAEAAAAHEATYPARSDDYGPSFRSFLEIGNRVRGPEYARADAVRRAYAGRLRDVFERSDVLACPSMPSLPPPASMLDLYATFTPETLARMQAFQRFTVPFDFSGSPTLSLPCGLSADGLPFSLQLVGRELEEPLLCRVGHAYEAATDGSRWRPPVASASPA